MVLLYDLTRLLVILFKPEHIKAYRVKIDNLISIVFYTLLKIRRTHRFHCPFCEIILLFRTFGKLWWFYWCCICEMWVFDMFFCSNLHCWNGAINTSPIYCVLPISHENKNFCIYSRFSFRVYALNMKRCHPNFMLNVLQHDIPKYLKFLELWIIWS